MIIILDFEKIVTDINPETGLKIEEIDDIEKQENRANYPIIIAEDSLLLNKLIVESLTKSGYTKLIHTSNGRECYEKIMEFKKEGTLDKNISLVITDIEMPEMDGHHLTKLLKTDDVTRHIPVVIFSSLVNEEMKRKGEALGADGQLSKPEIGNLVRMIDDLLLK